MQSFALTRPQQEFRALSRLLTKVARTLALIVAFSFTLSASGASAPHDSTSPDQDSSSSVETTIVKKHRQKTQVAKVKKSVRRGKQLSEKRNADPSRIASYVLFAICLALFSAHSNAGQSESQKSSPKSPGNWQSRFIPKAVFIGKDGTPDPATMEKESDQAADVEDDDEENSGSPGPANLMDTNAIRVRKPGNLIDRKADLGPHARPFIMPAEFAGHFTQIPGETLCKHFTFRVPLQSSGNLIITSRRILAIFVRYSFQLVPPKWERVQKRQQLAVRQIIEIKDVTARRPSLLVAGAFCCWWPPAGLLLAGIALVLYFAWPRMELGVLCVGGLRRSFPLGASERQEAQKILADLKERRARSKLAKVNKKQAAFVKNNGAAS